MFHPKFYEKRPAPGSPRAPVVTMTIRTTKTTLEYDFRFPTDQALLVGAGSIIAYICQHLLSLGVSLPAGWIKRDMDYRKLLEERCRNGQE